MIGKVWSVARNEYLASVRSKAFVVSIVIMPLVMLIAVGVQEWSQKSADRSDRVFAVVDKTGRLWPGIKEAAERRDAMLESRGGPLREPRFVPVRAEAATWGADALALSEKVDRGELFAFIVIGKDVIDDREEEGDGSSSEGVSKADRDDAITYHTNTPTYDALPQWLASVVGDEARRMRYERAGVDQKLIAKLNRPVHVRRMGLVEADAATGEVREAEETNPIENVAVPAGAMFLLFALVMISCPQLLNTVLEEKMSRVAELLVSSVTPFQLMLGKIAGAVMVTMTLSALYVGAAVFLLNHFGVAGMVPPHMYAWFALFLLLAVVMYGSLFVAIGAACSEIRDTQTMMTPAMLIIMLPVFTWMAVLRSPDSTFSIGLSLFPLATPMIMLLRIGIPPGPPAWQVVASVGLTLGGTLLAVAAAAKIFRIGILSYGQAPSLRRLVVWVFSR